MRTRIGDRKIQRIAITPSGATDALQIIGLRGGHGAENDGREITDVDTHLQGRRARQKVWVPRLTVHRSGFEAAFQVFSRLSFEQASMFSGKDPLYVSFAVQLSIVIETVF